MDSNDDSVFSVSEDFIEENQDLCSKSFTKRGGPYTKKETESRRNEVCRLHFEYGYSARKISDLIKINRNTINGDLQYWYSKIVEQNNIRNPELVIIINLQRLEIQRIRLREQIDKTNLFQEKILLERLIYEIDSKILYTHHRLAESKTRMINFSTERLNEWLKRNNHDVQYLTLYEKILTSTKARDKIRKIINEDKKQVRSI